MNETPQGTKPALRRTLTLVLAILSAIFLLFILLVAYYIWQIGQGKRQELAQQFDRKFTIDAEQTNAGRAKTVDATPFIRPHNPTLGNPDAPVTIIAFIDFECPFCRESYPVFMNVLNTYAPVVRVVFKHFPIDALHPNAVAAANAAACAHAQDAFWSYHDRLFETQALNATALHAHATSLGLNSKAFATCLAERTYQKNIDEDLADVAAIGVRGTPTFIVNNRIIEGVLSRAAWDELLLQEINAAKQ